MDLKDYISEKKSTIWRSDREILEIGYVSDSAAPLKPKTTSETKYLDTEASQEFLDFFQKIFLFLKFFMMIFFIPIFFIQILFL